MSSELDENALPEKVAELTALVEALTERVAELEKTIRRDHQTLEEDHRKIETMEMTGQTGTRPVGL